MNFWRQIPSGTNPPAELNMVIEVTDGSRAKFEYNTDWEAFVLDRIIPSSVVFPVEYGFVPQTVYSDGDPLDIMALSYATLTVGTVAKVRVIGVLEMEDEEGQDSKILSVPASDRRFEDIKDITDVAKHRLTEIREFFETYKRLQPCSWVKVKGWQNRDAALKDIEKAIAAYRKLPGYSEAITPD